MSGLHQVFIGGGGELATAREVLRHKTVEKCVMVDLDEASTEWSRVGVGEPERLDGPPLLPECQLRRRHSYIAICVCAISFFSRSSVHPTP